MTTIEIILGIAFAITMFLLVRELNKKDKLL
jgi:hypothetical protein